MNLKHSLVFFSAGVILILFLFLMGAIPMGGIIPPSSQQQQEENNKPNSEMPLEEESDYDDGDKVQLYTEQDIITIMQTKKSKPVEEMNCVELREFSMSFEKGWGSAVALHDKRCS